MDYSLIDNADGIVVLSGGGIATISKTNINEWSDPDRFIAGINLYKAKKATKLIFTGGASPFNSNPPEGDLYISEAISLGIPKKDLFTTKPVFNTAQEAKAIKKLLKMELNLNPKNIILVTSAFHMKRAKRVFEREGISVLPYPVDFKNKKSLFSSLRNPLKWIPNSIYLDSNSKAIREIIGRMIYGAWR